MMLATAGLLLLLGGPPPIPPATPTPTPTPAPTPVPTATPTPRPRTLRDVALELRQKPTRSGEGRDERARLQVESISSSTVDGEDGFWIAVSGTVLNAGVDAACEVRVRVGATTASGSYVGSADVATEPADVRGGRVASFSGRILFDARPRSKREAASFQPPALGPARASVVSWRRDCPP